MKHAVVVMLVCLLVLVCHDAHTDILYLKSGTQHTGQVVSEEGDKVVFHIGDAQDGIDVTFVSDEILRIDQIGAKPVIDMFMGDGPEFTIPRPLIQGPPIFANITQPIVPRERSLPQQDSEGNITPSDTQPAITVGSLLLDGTVGKDGATKEAQMLDAVKKQLDKTQ